MEKINFWKNPRWQLFFLLIFSAMGIFLITWHGVFQGYEGETAGAALSLLRGHYEIKRAGIGAVLLYIPFALIGFFLAPHNLTTFLTLVPLFYSALEAGVIFLCLNRLTKSLSASVVTTLLIAFGSSLWPYSIIGMEYQAGFCIALLFLALLRWRDGDGSAWVVGCVAAYLAITKSYGVIGLPAVLACCLLFPPEKLSHQKKSKIFFALTAPSCILIALGMAANFWLYGRFSGAYSLRHEFQLWYWWEGFFGFFFSVGKSIFIFDPLLIVAMILWPTFWRRDRFAAVFIVLILIFLLLINAPFSYWTDETWGPRKLVPIIALLHVPLVELWSFKRSQLAWWFIGVCVCASVYVQFLGAVYNYDRELRMLRSINFDSLETMRFVPELSHAYVYNRLWLAYVGVGSPYLDYSEPSWFRWTVPGQHDSILREAHVPLTLWKDPDSIWFTSVSLYKKIILAVLVVGAGTSLVVIYWICVKNKANPVS